MLESGDENRMTSVICDKCGKAIPYVKKTILGMEEAVLDRGMKQILIRRCLYEYY